MKWAWGTSLHLQTDNFYLDSLDPADIPDELFAWYKDDETMRHMNDSMKMSPQQLAKMFSAFDNKYRFALLARSRPDGAPVGLFRIFVDGRHSKAETSVLIGNKDYWGKNAVIEIRNRLLEFMFTALKLNKVCGSVRARNFPALFNYTRQGFDREGILKKQVLGRDGNFEDVVVFGMLKDTWLARRKEEMNAARNEPEKQ